jgi:hypothetical protein
MSEPRDDFERRFAQRYERYLEEGVRDIETRRLAASLEDEPSRRARWLRPVGLAAVTVAAAVVITVVAVQVLPNVPPVGTASQSPQASTPASGSAHPTPSGAVPSETAVAALPGFTTNAPTAPDTAWTSLAWRKLAADDPLALVRTVVRWSGGFIALGQEQAAGDTAWTPVWTSGDGVTWTSLDPSVFGSGTIVFDVAELPSGGLVALTGAGWADGSTTKPAQLWTSSDGRTWTAHPGPDVIAQAGLQSFEWPLLAAGPGGVLAATSTNRQPARAAISADGVTWTPLPDGGLPSDFAMAGLAGTADGYLAVGRTLQSAPEGFEPKNGVALTSTDGLYWTNHPLPDPGVGLLAWYADDLQVGTQGFIARGNVSAAPGAEFWWQSGDGQHWRLVPDYAPLGVSSQTVGRGADGQLLNDGSRILAVGFGGAAWVSFDGTHWDKLAVSGGKAVAGAATALFPGGALFVDTGPDGTTAWFGEASPSG